MSEEQHTHILSNFDKAIAQTRDDISQMASLTKENLELAVRGMIERDSDLCNRVIANDDTIDHLEMKIDKEGMQSIVLYQPVASDLRNLVSIMKLSSNLERVADLAVGIAKRGRKMNKNAELPQVKLIDPVVEQAISLFSDSLDAFFAGQVDSSLEIVERDDALDKTHKEVTKALTKQMEEEPERIKDYLDLIFTVRFLERVGDHAKNIAEESVFLQSAQDIRHGADRSSLEQPD